MTLKELLKAQGVDDDTITKIETEMQKNKMFIAGEENLDIRYNKLKKQHEDDQKTIEDLKKSTTGNEEAQKKIADYETRIKQLEEDSKKATLDAAIKVALLEAKAGDVDYLTYKLRAKETDLEVDENGKLKNADNLIKDLKTAYPGQFTESSKTKVKEKTLKGSDDHEDKTLTKEQFEKMSYMKRVKLMNENPDLYHQMAGQETNENTDKDTQEE